MEKAAIRAEIEELELAFRWKGAASLLSSILQGRMAGWSAVDQTLLVDRYLNAVFLSAFQCDKQESYRKLLAEVAGIAKVWSNGYASSDLKAEATYFSAWVKKAESFMEEDRSRAILIA